MSSSRSPPKRRTAERSGFAGLGCPTLVAANRATSTPRSRSSCRCRWTTPLASGRPNSRPPNLFQSLTRSRRLLLPLVFVSGMASLAVEFGASRLLAPYFGTSLYVWGVLIGLVLIYLSAGYVIGGRLADRHPEDSLLFQLTAWAGLWIGVIPLVSYPILLASQQGFAQLSVGLVAGTLLAVLVMFAAPVVLLGCVSPFAIRLLLRDVATGGNTAGLVYALSTAGSILGTFLPVFWFIPTYGTRPTLVGFALALLAPALIGLWPVPRRRWYAAFALIV